MIEGLEPGDADAVPMTQATGLPANQFWPDLPRWGSLVRRGPALRACSEDRPTVHPGAYSSDG